MHFPLTNNNLNEKKLCVTLVELSDISVHVIKDHDMFYDLVS